jgi:hypothetical protein
MKMINPQNRSIRIPIAVWTFLLGIGVPISVAVAQTRDPAAAEMLFQEGRRLMKVGQLQQACDKLAESLRLDAAAGTLANLADCEETRGRTATAWQHWRRAADQLAAGDPRREQARLRAARLEARLPRLRISVAPPALGPIKIERDGVTVGEASLGVALPVDPGHHVVLVTAPELWPRRYDLVIAEQESRALVVQAGEPLDPVPALPAPQAAAPAPVVQSGLARQAPLSQPPRLRVREWALLGAAAAGLGTGAYFGLRALQARGDASTMCAQQSGLTRCWSGAERSLEQDQRYSLLADLAVVAGATATATAIYLLTRPRTVDEPPLARLAAAPVRGGGEVQIAGTF